MVMLAVMLAFPEIPFSTALVTCLVLAIICLILLVAFLADDIIRLRAGESAGLEADHSECADTLAAFFAERLFAERIRHLATKYDSEAGIREMAFLRREMERQRTAGGPTLPAMWLRLQADHIDPPTPADDGFVMLNGDRA